MPIVMPGATRRLCNGHHASARLYLALRGCSCALRTGDPATTSTHLERAPPAGVIFAIGREPSVHYFRIDVSDAIPAGVLARLTGVFHLDSARATHDASELIMPMLPGTSFFHKPVLLDGDTASVLSTLSVPSELPLLLPSRCSTTSHNNAGCTCESLATALAPLSILAEMLMFPFIPELAEGALGLAIVVFQNDAEHIQPRYFTANLTLEYSVDGAAVRLYFATNSSHAVQRVYEEIIGPHLVQLRQPWPHPMLFVCLGLGVCIVQALGLSFASNALFPVKCNCSSKCGSLQYVLHLLLARTDIQSDCYLSGVLFSSGFVPLMIMKISGSVVTHGESFWRIQIVTKFLVYAPSHQIVWCVLAELVESWKYLMVMCWNSGAAKISLQMSKYMARVDAACPCYVEVADFSEFGNGRPAKPEALAAADHGCANSYSGFILLLSGDEATVASSPVMSNVLSLSLHLGSEHAAHLFCNFLAEGNGNPHMPNCGTCKGPSESLDLDGQAQEIIDSEAGWPMDGDKSNDDIYPCITACFVAADWKLQRLTVEVYLVHLIIDRRTWLLPLGVDIWSLIILPAHIHQGMFLLDDVHVLVPVIFAKTGATLGTFPVVVWLSYWLSSRLLWEPPWALPALVGIIDVVDDDQEHEAEDVVTAESIERQLSKTALKNQMIVQLPWDPDGSKFLNRLGGKPKLKKGGMSGITTGWAVIWAVGLGLGLGLGLVGDWLGAMGITYKSAGAPGWKKSINYQNIYLYLVA